MSKASSSLSVAVLVVGGLALGGAEERAWANTRGVDAQVSEGEGERGRVNPRLLRRFRAVANTAPAAMPDSPAAIELGRALWYDTRLSRDRDLSCNSCHDLQNFGVDNAVVSSGHRGQLGRRNTPSVYNAGGRFVQFWDGRARTLEDQAPGPLQDPKEMALPGNELVARIKGIDGYRAMFAQAFPTAEEPVSLASIADALSAFERGLVTRGRWDAFLAGKEDALTNDEIAGLKTFLDVGCVSCHTGPEVGASMFQTAGALKPWPNGKNDLGRFEITGNPVDKMVFRVPSLRNVARTAPYFHDGSVKDLSAAVRMMADLQLDVQLTDAEVTEIVAFLNALTGEIPAAYIEKPTLPDAMLAQPAAPKKARSKGM
jgi:cytochrome c peroxidase